MINLLFYRFLRFFLKINYCVQVFVPYLKMHIFNKYLSTFAKLKQTIKKQTMKKIILVAVAIFFFGYTNAQEAKFGIKAGLNLSNWAGDTDGLDIQSKAGLNIGGFVAIKLSDKITLQPELLYSMEGTKVNNFQFDYQGSIYYVDASFNLSYINVPLMMKFYPTEKFNLEAGPQVGFLVSAKTVAKVNGNKGDDNVKDSFESVNFGLNFGAAYDFTKNISAGVRYNFGLSNLAKTVAGDNTKIHGNVVSLSVGYSF